jgi:hypothetical protein
MQTKSQKKLILAAAARFNAKPKTGIAFLEENHLIYSDLSPGFSKADSLAVFLKGCTRLDKRLLGDYISKPENIDILKAFIGLFDFNNVSPLWKLLMSCLPDRLILETDCRCHAGAFGIFPTSWRSAADIENYRNICYDLLCSQTR